eukprot:gene29999-42650_t
MPDPPPTPQGGDGDGFPPWIEGDVEEEQPPDDPGSEAGRSDVGWHLEAVRMMREQMELHCFEGPTHPLANSLLFCNFDVGIFDRVINVQSFRGLSGAEKAQAVRDCWLTAARQTHNACRYACNYATKPALQTVGISLADLEKRIQEREATEGEPLPKAVRQRMKLQRACSGHDKAYQKSLLQAMFPYLGTEYTPDAKDRAFGPRQTRLVTHKFWEVQMKLRDQELIREWEHKRRRIATLGGIWDELWDSCKCDVCSAEERDEAQVIEAHFDELYALAQSLFARRAVEVIATMEEWAQSLDARYNKKIPKSVFEEGASKLQMQNMLADMDM